MFLEIRFSYLSDISQELNMIFSPQPFHTDQGVYISLHHMILNHFSIT